MHTLVSVLGAVFASKGYPFKNILSKPIKLNVLFKSSA